MPLYDYRCPTCGHRFEVMRPITNCATAVCERCGQTAERVWQGRWNFGKPSGQECSGNCSSCAGCGNRK